MTAASEARPSGRASDARPSGRTVAVAVWGVGGFLALIVRALWSLTPLAIDAIRSNALTPLEIVILAGWIAFMAYSEGYKGFQRQMSPRLVSRAMYAGDNPRPALVALAPAFAMGLFHATRKRLAVSWGILIGVVILVIAVRTLSQPWRGIVDAGVVVGLAWGVAATVYYFAAALRGRPPEVDLDLPAGPPDGAVVADGPRE